MKRLGLDQIWWLVSPQNPLKRTKGMGPFRDRLREAKAEAHHPRIVVTDIESELGTRFTADTLRQLKLRFPRVQFVWLMGADNMLQIARWRDWQDIFATVPVAVFRRPAYAGGKNCGKAAQRFDGAWLPLMHGKNLARQKPPAWLVMDNPLYPISATEIRKDPTSWHK